MVDPPYRKRNMMSGMIMMWHDSIATIPSGWHLCDGTAGTIDLRNKFVIGAGDLQNPNAEGTTNMTTDANWPWYALCFIQKIN